MRKIKLVQQTIEINEDILCNKCGESAMRGPEDLKTFYGACIDFVTGYYSKELGDGLYYQFELCEKCIDELIKTLLIPPKITGQF